MRTEGMVNQVVGVAECRPHPRNYNQHEAGQIADLRVSLRRFGQVRSVVVQAQSTSDGEIHDGYLIVAGHGVVEAARLEGMEELRADVIPADWDEATVLAYLAADNELARQGTADEEQLAALVADVKARADEELARLAAGCDERLKELLAGLEPPAADPGAQVDKAEELLKKWGVKTGDLWEIGAHRLVCGDCTDAAVVARVMGGEKADMVFTDPPYATFGSSTGKQEAGDFAMLKPFFRLLFESMASNTKEGRAVFVCCDWRTYPLFYELLQGKFKVNNLIVWKHGALKMGSASFRFSYELLVYALNMPFKRSWKRGPAGFWKVEDRGQPDVWEIKQGEAAPGVNRLHGSQKPTELAKHAIMHCSNRGEIVFDFFAGSGTTLIACEQLGRRGRGIEITPNYCAVTLERLAGMGLEPRLVESTSDGSTSDGGNAR